jgi:hypothetical protein
MEKQSLTLLFAFSILPACSEAQDTVDTSSEPTLSDLNKDWSWNTLVPDEGTRWVFRNTVTGEDFEGTIGADEDVDGRPYTPFTIGDFTTTKTERFLVDLDFTTPFILEIKRMSWFFAGETEPFEYYDITPPLELPLFDIVGATATYDSSAIQVDGKPIDISATTTLVEKNVTLTVPIGDVTGCRKYHLDVSLPYKVPLDVWFQSEYAFVKSTDYIGGAHWELVSFTQAG